ncbi:serine protease [Massilia arenosa]|uniref:Serine protease n=1 Tax=Zemynaea arenosa TaxID=2561931 RepID=A0A4Y9RXK8_9BURK|nr:S1C family serine protease [Massilia arenosa]TFW13702.1 serine protease [Massilia arenosa]
MNIPRTAAVFILAFSALSVLPAQAAATDPQTAGAPALPALENSVVKIFATLRRPDMYRPWGKAQPLDVSGSGVVIEGNRILTNAHVVGYASQVQVQPNQSGEKLSATVEAIAPGIDLAILKLEDESFFKTHKPAPRSSALPEVRDAVFAYGYPTGGTSLSITKGIVSRIEFVPYSHATAGLRVQIDAAINHGNSGGPVVSNDKMIGLAFSGAANTQNIGYIIPNEEIELFLHDIRDGHYDGKVYFLEDVQTMENPALRDYLKLDKGVEGAVVNHPYSDDPSYPIKEWDVITRIGDAPVDSEGMVRVNPNLRVRFTYKVQQLARDGKVPLTIIRNGKAMTVNAPVYAKRPRLLDSLNGSYPSYFVYGPVVFTRGTTEFLGGIAGNAVALINNAATGNPMLLHMGDKPTAEQEELVVIAAPFFTHKSITGYSNRQGAVLKSVNGVPVKSLKHLVALLRDSKDDLLQLRFHSRPDETIVLKRKDVVAATDTILADNGIRFQGSPDMMEVWEGKAK